MVWCKWTLVSNYTFELPDCWIVIIRLQSFKDIVVRHDFFHFVITNLQAESDLFTLKSSVVIVLVYQVNDGGLTNCAFTIRCNN